MQTQRKGTDARLSTERPSAAREMDNEADLIKTWLARQSVTQCPTRYADGSARTGRAH